MKILLCGLLCSALGLIAASTTEDWSNVDVTPLTELNSPGIDCLPSLSADGKILFFVSNRKTTLRISAGMEGAEIEDSSQNIWLAFRLPNGSFEHISPSVGLNKEQLGDGSLCPGLEKNVCFFAACDRRDGYGTSDIYMQTDKKVAEKAHMSEVFNLGHEINSRHWEGTPVVAPDGTLYFASDRPGGHGGMDIWFSRYDAANKKWAPVQNAGPEINTPGDDMAPAMSPDGKQMVFASTGHTPSFGDYDLYICTLISSGKATKPVNLGEKINSPRKEVGAWFTPEGDILYFASAREKSTNLDLYQAKLH